MVKEAEVSQKQWQTSPRLCHIVGDFQPVTSDRAKGPDLANVYRRLRADYVRRWVAQPTSLRSLA